MAIPLPKTYEELRAERDVEWRSKQVIAQQQLKDLHETLIRMPDVRDAPSPDIEWSHPDIFCAEDAGKYFRVTRWVTVNGLRYRAEMVCSSCGHLDTWDWNDRKWMGG